MQAALLVGLTLLGGCIQRVKEDDTGDTGSPDDTADTSGETDTAGDSETDTTGDSETDTGETDTDTDTAPNCAEGQIFDGEVCVPEICGVAPWGNIPVDETTVYVDGNYPYHGTGTPDNPFIHISEALDHCALVGIKSIAVARANYQEDLRISADHDGIRLYGRCSDLVIVDSHNELATSNGMTADGVTDFLISGIRFDAAPVRGMSVINGSTVTAMDIEVTNSTTTGVVVQSGGTLTMTNARFDLNHEIGVLVSDTSSHAFLTNLEITRTAVSDDGTGGIGLSVQNGATVEVDTLNVQDSTERGIQARGNRTIVDLVNVAVGGTLPNADGYYGHGMDVEDGAVVTCTSCSFIDNTEIGVSVDGVAASLTMTDSESGGTVVSLQYPTARGIVASTRASLTLNNVTVARNYGAGLHVAGAATATVVDSTFMENRFAEVVLEDGTASLRGSSFTGTVADGTLGGGVGLYAGGEILSGRSLLMDNVTMSDALLASVWLDGAGSYHISNSDIEGTPGVVESGLTINGNAVYATGGIEAWDGATGLWLDGNTYSNAFIGVLLDNASASLTSSVWSANGIDLVQQTCDVVTPVAYDGSPLTDLCPADPYPSRSFSFDLYP